MKVKLFKIVSALAVLLAVACEKGGDEPIQIGSQGDNASGSTPKNKQKSDKPPPEPEITGFSGVIFGDSVDEVVSALGEPVKRQESEKSISLAYQLKLFGNEGKLPTLLIIKGDELVAGVVKPKDMTFDQCEELRGVIEDDVGPGDSYVNPLGSPLYSNATLDEAISNEAVEFVHAWRASGALIKLVCSPEGGMVFMEGDSLGEAIGGSLEDLPSLEQAKRIYSPVQADGIEYEISGISISTAAGDRKLKRVQAADGAKFVVIVYKMTNQTKQTTSVPTSAVRLKDKEGREFSPSSRAMAAAAMSLDDVDLAISQLQPGIPREQIVVFEVPMDVWAFALLFPSAEALPVKVPPMDIKHR